MSAHALKIRAVESFDLPVLAALHEACFTAPWDQHWSQRSFSEVLAMPGAGARIAAVGAEPVGFALARVAADEAELLLLGVHPEYRRAGHAGALLAHLIAELTAAGASRVFLEVAEANAPAIAFYRAAGFRPVGRRPGYYDGRDRGGRASDAIILARALHEEIPPD